MRQEAVRSFELEQGRVESFSAKKRIYWQVLAGIAQLARASAFQAEGRGFESRFPLHYLALQNKSRQALIAQLVERILGKDEVTSSNLVEGSTFFLSIFVYTKWLAPRIKK